MPSFCNASTPNTQQPTRGGLWLSSTPGHPKSSPGLTLLRHVSLFFFHLCWNGGFNLRPADQAMKPNCSSGGTRPSVFPWSSCSHKQGRRKCRESSWVWWGCKPDCCSWEKNDSTPDCWVLLASGRGLLFLQGTFRSISLALALEELSNYQLLPPGLGWWCEVWQLSSPSKCRQRPSSDSSQLLICSSLPKHNKYVQKNTVSICSSKIRPESSFLFLSSVADIGNAGGHAQR